MTPDTMSDYDRGWEDGIRALSQALRKVLTPESIESLRATLQQRTEGEETPEARPCPFAECPSVPCMWPSCGCQRNL